MEEQGEMDGEKGMMERRKEQREAWRRDFCTVTLA